MVIEADILGEKPTLLVHRLFDESADFFDFLHKALRRIESSARSTDFGQLRLFSSAMKSVCDKLRDNLDSDKITMIERAMYEQQIENLKEEVESLETKQTQTESQ